MSSNASSSASRQILRFPHPSRSASSGRRQTRRRVLSAPNTPLGGQGDCDRGLVSLVSPIDAILDLMPLGGLTDAVGVLTLTFAKLAADLKKHLPS